jgi:antitoxin MazE
MEMSVKVRIVNIGNSRGIRIPKLLLEEANLGEEVELDVKQGQLILRRPSHPRSDWEAKFREMGRRGDDQLLDSEIFSTTSWDDKEWDW